MADKSTNLVLYLIALSFIQSNDRTHVNHEIMDAIEAIKQELEIKK